MSLSRLHDRRKHHALRRPLVVAVGAVLACAGSASAGAVTRPHPAKPSPIHLITHRPSANKPAVIGSNVQILNGWTGYHLCLDAENDSGGTPNDNGDKVQLWTCNSGATQQRWNLNFDIGSTGTITSAYGNHLCLDAETDSTSNPADEGDKVQMWTCNSGAAQQQWAIGTLPDGSHEIVNTYVPATQATMALAAENDSGGAPSQCGDNVQLQNYTGQNQQLWTVGGSPSGCS